MIPQINSSPKLVNENRSGAGEGWGVVCTVMKQEDTPELVNGNRSGAGVGWGVVCTIM
jgi:hypothetical protein